MASNCKTNSKHFYKMPVRGVSFGVLSVITVFLILTKNLNNPNGPVYHIDVECEHFAALDCLDDLLIVMRYCS